MKKDYDKDFGPPGTLPRDIAAERAIEAENYFTAYQESCRTVHRLAEENRKLKGAGVATAELAGQIADYAEPFIPPERMPGMRRLIDALYLRARHWGKLESREGLRLTETQQEKEGPAPNAEEPTFKGGIRGKYATRYRDSVSIREKEGGLDHGKEKGEGEGHP